MLDEVNFIISFDDAKFVLASYDYIDNDIKVLEIVNAEENAFGEGSFVGCSKRGKTSMGGVGFHPFIAVDTNSGNKLACSVVYGQQLLFIPCNKCNADAFKDPLSTTGTTASSVLISSMFYKELILDNSNNTNNILASNSNSCSMGPIWDICFLASDTSTPLLAILHEPDEVPIGHYLKVKHTKCITVIAINVAKKAVTTMWRHRSLPYDCMRIYPLQHSFLKNSVVIVGMNAFLVATCDSVMGVAMNGFSKLTVSKHIKLYEAYPKLVNTTKSGTPVGLELDGSKWQQVVEDHRSLCVGCGSTDSEFVGVLKDGTVVQITMSIPKEGTWLLNSVFDVNVLLQTTVVQPTTFEMTRSRTEDMYYWFVGSRLSDGLFLEAHLCRKQGEAISVLNNGLPGGAVGMNTPVKSTNQAYSTPVVTPMASNKKRRLTLSHRKATSSSAMDINQELDRLANEVTEEEITLYGDELNLLNPAAVGMKGWSAVGKSLDRDRDGVIFEDSKWSSITVVDYIPVMGPIMHGFVAPADSKLDQVDSLEWLSTSKAEGQHRPKRISKVDFSPISDYQSKDALYVAAGKGDNSGLYRMAKGFRVSKLAGQEFVGCIGFTTVTCPELKSVIMFLSFPDKCRVFVCSETEVCVTNSGGNTDKSSGASTESSTASVVEMSALDSPFIMTEATVSVSIVHSQGVGEELVLLMAQVCKNGVRVLSVSPRQAADTVLGCVVVPVQDMILADELEMGGLGGSAEDSIVSVDYDLASSRVMLLTASHLCFVLRYDAGDESLVIEHQFGSKSGDDESVGSGDEDSNKLNALLMGFLRIPDREDKTMEPAAATPSGVVNVIHASFYFGSLEFRTEVEPKPDSRFHSTSESHPNSDCCREELEMYGHILPLKSVISSTPVDYAVDYAAVASRVLDDVPDKHAEGEEVSVMNTAGKEKASAKATKAKAPTKGKRGTKRSNSVDDFVANEVETYCASATDASNEHMDVDHLSSSLPAVEQEGEPPLSADTLYLVLCLDNGNVLFVNTATHSVVFHSFGFSDLKNTIKCNEDVAGGVGLKSELNATAGVNVKEMQGQKIVNCRVIELKMSPHAARGEGILCVVCVLSNGDVGIYRAQRDEKCIFAFRKIEHSCVTRKKRHQMHPKTGKRLSLNKPPPPPVPPPESVPPSVLAATSSLLTPITTTSAGGITSVIISGNSKPIIVSLDGHGLPFVYPISFPELPYTSSCSNNSVSSGGSGAGIAVNHHASTETLNNCGTSGNGYYIICSCSLNTTEGLVSMWFEEEMLTVQPPPPPPTLAPMHSQPPKPPQPPVKQLRIKNTLGIYQNIAKLDVLFNGNFNCLSAKKHHCSDNHFKRDKAAASTSVSGGTSDSSGFDIDTIDFGSEAKPTLCFCKELLGSKTDQKIERELLKCRTYVLVTSEDAVIVKDNSASIVTEYSTKTSMFVPTVLTEEEMEYDHVHYERFFDVTDSFEQPTDVSLSKSSKMSISNVPPAQFERLYKLHLVQNGQVIDTYVLDEGEHVMDMEVAYLSAPVNIPATATSSVRSNINGAVTSASSSQLQSKAFVLLATNKSDKHGEDTQGEGGLLFFGMDYSQFEGNREREMSSVNAVESGDSTTKASTDATSTGRVEVSEVKMPENDVGGKTHTDADKMQMNADGVNTESDLADSNEAVNAPSKNPNPEATTATAIQSSTTSSSFMNSLQLKTSLLWRGPGPSSIVKQFNIKLPKSTHSMPLYSEYIIATVGSMLYVYKYNSATTELDQVAFYIAQNYIKSVSVIKNYILIADACSCVQFLVWHEEDCNIVPMAKDNYRSSAYATGFVVDNRKLSMIVSDMEGNIQAFAYNPKSGGEGYRLIPIADMHVGSDIITTIPHPLLLPSSSCVNALYSVGKGRRSLGATANTNTIAIQYGTRMDKKLSTRSCLIVGSDRGGLGVLLPLDERVYRRLALLQQLLSMTISTTFCLNPRDYRNMKLLLYRFSPMIPRKKGILDGNILSTYCALESKVQHEIAVAMGTNVDIILENISDMEYMTNFF